jgi:hypothetical protein
MALKINNTTVVDDSRNLTNIVAIYANNTIGDAGSLLASTGVGITWSDSQYTSTFNTGITTSQFFSVNGGQGSNVTNNNNIFVGPGVAYTFESTAGKQYIIESIHLVNTFEADLYVSARHKYAGGKDVPILNRVIVPYQSAVEILSQPIVANSSDFLSFQALTGIGPAESGIDGGMSGVITFSQKDSISFIGTGKTVTSLVADGEIFQSTLGPSVIQSIRLINYSLLLDVDATIAIYSDGTPGSVVDTGSLDGYLAFNLTIPANSTVEICERQKYLKLNDTIVATASTTNSLSVGVSGRYIL